MNASVHLINRRQTGRPGLVLLGLLSLMATTALHAASITGTYDDKGTQVSGANGPVPEASLHALLGQQPDLTLGALEYHDSSHVRLVELNNSLSIEIFDGDDQRIWSGVWGGREGFSRNGDTAIVRMKLGDSDDKRWVLLMQPAKDGQLLEVKVYRVLPSSVGGPYTEPVGTYLFPRRD